MSPTDRRGAASEWNDEEAELQHLVNTQRGHVIHNDAACSSSVIGNAYEYDEATELELRALENARASK